MATLQDIMAIDQSVAAQPQVSQQLIPNYDPSGRWIGYTRAPDVPGTSPDRVPQVGGAQTPDGPGSTALGRSWSDPALGVRMQAIEQALANPDYDKFKAPAGKQSGYLANVGAGTSEAVASTLGLPVDVATGLINLVPRTINTVAGTQVPIIENPVGGSEFFRRAQGLIGANPENVVPADRGEQLARSAATGAASMLAPGAIARALPAVAAPVTEAVRSAVAAGGTPVGGVMGAAGGVSGQVASEQVPDSLKPLALFLGNLAGGAVVAGTAAALRGAGRTVTGASDIVRGPLGLGGETPVIDPATGQHFTKIVGATETGEPIRAPVTATSRQQAMAGDLIARGAGTEPGELAGSIPADSGEIIPGSQLTVGQATGNEALLARERQFQNTAYGRAAFARQAAQNNLARVAALEGAAPEEVSNAARGYLKARLVAMQAEEEAAATGARATAETALESAGAGTGLPTQQEIGAGQQAALEARRFPEKAAAGRALDAIDPEGKLALDLKPVGERAREILQSEVGEGGTLHSAEAAVLDAASKYRGVELFSKLRSLMGNTAAAMRQIARNPELGRESQPYRRISMLMGTIQDTLAEAAAGQAERDAAAVGSGTMAPEQSITARLRAEIESEPRTGPTGGGGPDRSVSGGQGGTAATGGAPVSGTRGPSDAAGDSNVAAGTAARKPESLIDFLISRGGVRDQGGELRASDLQTLHHRMGGRLINNTRGMPLDYAREAAAEAGFIRPNADLNEFLDAVTSQRPVYRIDEAADAALQAQRLREGGRESHDRFMAGANIDQTTAAMGVRLSPAEHAHATDLHLFGAHPDDAVRQAALEGEDAILQRNAERNAVGSLGVPLAARQAEMPIERTQLAENFPPQTRAQLSAANKQYAEYKAKWRTGPIGDVLASGPRSGEFRLGASQVPAKLFPSGPKGAEAADALIKAAGSREAAVQTLGDYPALTLRNEAMKDGALSIPAYDKWKAKYAGVLGKFPEIAAKFDTAATAQIEAEQAAARGQQRIADYENSAARHYLGKGEAGADNHTAIQRLMGSENPAAAARDLMTQVSGNEAAIAGIRRNVFEWLQNRATTTAEAGTTGVRELSGAAYQRIINNPKVDPALRTILTPEQYRVARSVAEDLASAARSWNAIKIPGSPTTAADLAAAGHGEGVSNLTSMLIAERAVEYLAHAGGAGSLTAMLTGGTAAVGMRLLQAARAAGLYKVSDLATEGVLNPALGRVLDQAAVRNPRAPIMAKLRQRIVALGSGAALSSQQRPQEAVE